MEKETIANLQESVEKLAQGVNPFTGEIARDDEILNDVKVSRCLFAVNGVLKELLNGKTSAKKSKKHKFEYRAELTPQIKIEDYSISLSQIVRNILEVYGKEVKLTYYDLAQILYDRGLFVDNTEETPRMIASEKAEQYGIFLKRVHGNAGDRWQTVFDQNGQRFAIDLLQNL